MTKREIGHTLPTKHRAGLKDHDCTWCGCPIKKGETHHYWRSVGNSYVENRMHDECLASAVAAGDFEFRPRQSGRRTAALAAARGQCGHLNCVGMAACAFAPTPGVQEGVPTWQQRTAERAAFERGVSAMRDVAVTVIRARHESGYSCDPWKLVEAIRAAKEPTDPAGVRVPSAADLEAELRKLPDLDQDDVDALMAMALAGIEHGQELRQRMERRGKRPVCKYSGKVCQYEGASCTCCLPGFQGDAPTEWVAHGVAVPSDADADAWARGKWPEHQLHDNGADTPLMKLIRRVWTAAAAAGVQGKS